MNSPSYPQKIDLNVTQEHIDNGICAKPSGCALALALKELFPDKYPVVGMCSCFIYTNEQNYLSCIPSEKYYRLSEDARNFIERFDNQRPVEPGIFILESYV